MSSTLRIATRKGLFAADRNGASSWSITGSSFLGDNVTLSLVDPVSGNHFAALDHGHFGIKLHRSSDGAKTWQEIATPEYPKRPQGAEPEVDAMGRTIPDTLQLIWSLETGSADQPGRLWCGTIPGGLFRSDNHGDSWTLVEALWNHPDRAQWMGGGADYPGIHSICVDPRNSQRVAVGVSCGGVWLTEDDGATWLSRAQGMWAAYTPPEHKFNQAVQDPHRVVQCAGEPDHYWAQHHNGVFRTTDGCESWQEVTDIKPSNFGFAVAVHPEQGDTAWLVPGISDEKRIPVDGKVVVTRTRDGGGHFDILDQGLPQEHAYDIAFRHALDIDTTGQTLAFGTTTGSVFISDDQGDHFQCVAANLPPVYAVRFDR